MDELLIQALSILKLVGTGMLSSCVTSWYDWNLIRQLKSGMENKVTLRKLIYAVETHNQELKAWQSITIRTLCLMFCHF